MKEMYREHLQTLENLFQHPKGQTMALSGKEKVLANVFFIFQNTENNYAPLQVLYFVNSF